MTAPATQRAYSAHQPKWQRFQSDLIIPSAKAGPAGGGKGQQQPYQYQRQYSHVYHQRLAVLGPRCWERIAQEVKDDSNLTKVTRILELRESVPSVVVGTLVMERNSSGGKKEETLHPDSYCKKSDALYLEDESGRVTLEIAQDCDSLCLHEFCNGVVAGVQGTVGTDGVMRMQAVFYPTPPPPAVTSSSPGDNETDDKSTPHLLLLSGLNFGGDEASSLPCDMLISFLQGRFGIDKAACVSHVVIAGGLVRSAGGESDSSCAAALRDLDVFLLQLTASGLPVVVIPGQHDPTTANWPQRPLHSALLPRTCHNMGQMLARTPNPYAATHNNQVVIGTDGTNVRDLTKQLLQRNTKPPPSASTSDELEPEHFLPVTELQALQRTLEWSHICPTGPDSVPTAPHVNEDPMVLTQWPVLYFSGNAQQFATTKLSSDQEGHQPCRLVCIPQFATTGQAVLVNLQSLDVEVLQFED